MESIGSKQIKRRKLLLLSGDEDNILEKFILGAWLALSVWEMGQRKLGHDSHRYGRFIIIVAQRKKSLYKAKRGCFISYTHLSTIRYMIQ